MFLFEGRNLTFCRLEPLFKKIRALGDDGVCPETGKSGIDDPVLVSLQLHASNGCRRTAEFPDSAELRVIFCGRLKPVRPEISVELMGQFMAQDESEPRVSGFPAHALNTELNRPLGHYYGAILQGLGPRQPIVIDDMDPWLHAFSLISS